MGWDLKEYKLGNRVYKLGDMLLLYDGSKVIIRKVEGDNILYSVLDEEDVPKSDEVQGVTQDYFVKKIIKEVYPPNFKVAFLDRCEDVINFVTGIPHNIKNFFWEIHQFFRWGWFMRNNWDWDSNFLLEMIDKKLADMEKHQRESAYHMSRYSCARQIALTRGYLNRMLYNTAEKEWHNLFEKKYGKQGVYFQKFKEGGSQWVNTEYSKCEGDPKKQAWAEKLYTRLLLRVIPRACQKDRDKFWYLFNKYYQHWWD